MAKLKGIQVCVFHSIHQMNSSLTSFVAGFGRRWYLLSSPSLPLTYMNNVPVLIDHDVSIMPVLDLQNVADQGVRRHALDEVCTGLKWDITKNFLLVYRNMATLGTLIASVLLSSAKYFFPK